VTADERGTLWLQQVRLLTRNGFGLLAEAHSDGSPTATPPFASVTGFSTRAGAP